MSQTGQLGQTVFPALRYADANAAIEWLGRAFGLQEHNVYRDDEGNSGTRSSVSRAEAAS